MLNFVSSAMGVLNHPERVAVYPVEFGKSNVILWNNNVTINQIQSYISSITQWGFSIWGAGQIMNEVMYITQTAPTPISIIFFITDTSGPDLYYIKDYLDGWSPRVRITFVLVGPKADSAPLRKFSTKYHYIYWPDLSQPQPDNWAALSNLVYGCESLN
uniref:VWFA domain-containing protein n=1 Tax=Panagrolaimus davidi TaxID=227884 RepID=A0A914PQT2_9BILA